MIYKSKLNQIAQQLQKGLAVMVLGAAVLTSCNVTDKPDVDVDDVTEFPPNRMPTGASKKVADTLEKELTLFENINVKQGNEKEGSTTKKDRRRGKKIKKYNNRIDAYNKKRTDLIDKEKAFNEDSNNNKNPKRKNTITFFGLRRTKYQNALKKRNKLQSLKDSIEGVEREKKGKKSKKKSNE